VKPESHSLTLGESLQGFFKAKVADVAHRRGSTTTEAVQGYLVGLLSDFARPESLMRDTLERPLTLLLYEARSASGFERFERLRTLGDGVLYVAGFFRDHIESRGVELSYVRALGAQAYGSVSQMLKRPVSNIEQDADIFRELSENFHEFAELLFEIGEAFQVQAAAPTPRATVQLYERWLKTGSVAVQKALSERGIVPLRGTGTLH
jgi:hypothetical protein